MFLNKETAKSALEYFKLTTNNGVIVHTRNEQNDGFLRRVGTSTMEHDEKWYIVNYRVYEDIHGNDDTYLVLDIQER